MICPNCDEDAGLEAIHNAAEIWDVSLDARGKLDYDYLDTFHDGCPDPGYGDILQCAECQAEFTEEEAPALLQQAKREES